MSLKWISIVCSSIYDDIILSNYLTIKEFLCAHLQIAEKEIYHSATVYALGFLLGGVFWNVVTKCRSVKRTLILCQVSLLASTILFLLSSTLTEVFTIRFMQGLFASGAFISINVLVKHNFRQNDFNRFLALTTLFPYIAEAVMPIINGVLNRNYGFRASIVLLIVILVVSMYTMFLDLKDVHTSCTVRVACIETVSSYVGIIKSRLLIILIIAGLTEGLVDLLFNVLDEMIRNIAPEASNQLLTISISTISIFSSLCTNIVPYFTNASDDSKRDNLSHFDWSNVHNDKDRKILYFLIEVALLALISSSIKQFSSHYYSFMFYLILVISTLCVVNYISIKIMYSVYYSSGCVASSLSLSETFMSTGIQGISSFAARVKDNRLIFLYCIFYFILILALLNWFYRSIPDSKSQTRYPSQNQPQAP